jgi:hypothetical protein
LRLNLDRTDMPHHPSERDNELIIRADLPGMTKDDIKVDIADNAIAIRGERKSEREEDEEGYYRSERTYGSFYRGIPLPRGAIGFGAGLLLAGKVQTRKAKGDGLDPIFVRPGQHDSDGDASVR